MRRTLILALTLVALNAFAADETCPTKWKYPESVANGWTGNCSNTTLNQSPIRNNADQRRQATLPLAQLDYIGGARYPITLKNTSTELKAVPMFNGTLTWGTVKARLIQFHFHTPIENRLDQWHGASAELHLVHQAPDGKLYVVAVAISLGTESEKNPAITALQALGTLQACHSAASHTDAQLVPMKALLPAETRRYITYVGSLTTPPCSPNVTFIMMNDGIKATQEQLNALRAIANNARDPQHNNNPVTYRVAGQ